MSDERRFSVTGAAAYDVVVGRDVLGGVVGALPDAERVLVVADERVAPVGQRVADTLRSADVDAHLCAVPAGESAKSFDRVRALWDELARQRITRSDAVVAVGGGATTDVGGFAAATWLRGVRVVQVPTTLLGAVDAAIGGKTGINTAAGKNLVGAFHPPAAVLVDLDVLASLPPAEWANGMAEVVKAGFIADPVILDLVEADPADAASPQGAAARELVERAIAVKVQVVSADLREAGPREVLNYGHTLGHAIERLENYRLPHGHAISIGMVYVAALARRAGRLDAETAERHRVVLDRLGLPTSYRRDAFDDLLEVMRMDKKARGAVLRFVVLDGLARPGILAGPPPDLLRAAYDEVAR